jgi:hypothetical protein
MAKARNPGRVVGSACKFQVPLADNDGHPFDPQVFIDIKRAVDRLFGGFTILGEREGSYEGQVERSLWIEVFVPSKRIEEFRELVRATGRALGQRAMYIEIPPPCAEILLIEPQGGTEKSRGKGRGRGR